MPLVITPAPAGRGDPRSIDFTGVVPARVAGMSATALARLPIRADERPAELGDLFSTAGDATDGCLELAGDFSRVHFVAAGMECGTIRVLGPVGRHAAEGMRGGRLEVAGAAGDWLACGLAGGEVHVTGAAGDNAAAALPGSPVGMTGGLVTIAGGAGALAGARMRRGILAVGGDCGLAPAFEMRAGTVVVAGAIAGQPGVGMGRGSLVVLAAPPEPLPTFRRGAAWCPAFLPLLLRRLAAAGFAPARRPLPTAWRQWHGDVLAGGRGEILHPA